jgi:hypothetical protein
MSAITHAELAALLLRDAAAFFHAIADQHDARHDEMTEHAVVFEQAARMVERDALGILHY